MKKVYVVSLHSIHKDDPSNIWSNASIHSIWTSRDNAEQIKTLLVESYLSDNSYIGIEGQDRRATTIQITENSQITYQIEEIELNRMPKEFDELYPELAEAIDKHQI